MGALLLIACDINGNSQTYPGASVFEAPDKGFHFHFLAPPWRYHKKESKHLVHLVVDSYSQFSRSDDVTITHKLFVGYDATTNPQVRMQELRDQALKEGRAISVEVETFSTLTGEMGWQHMSHKDDPKEGGRFYYRDALLHDANAKWVLFKLIAAYPLDERDVDDLLFSFSAGPDDGTETPPRLPDGGSDPPLDGLTSDGGGG